MYHNNSVKLRKKFMDYFKTILKCNSTCDELMSDDFVNLRSRCVSGLWTLFGHIWFIDSVLVVIFMFVAHLIQSILAHYTAG
jgi:hypothetical protein